MSKDEGNPNDEARTGVKTPIRFSPFELRHSFFIRHSDFGIDNRLSVNNLLALA
jgi:hypothetical protein